MLFEHLEVAAPLGSVPAQSLEALLEEGATTADATTPVGSTLLAAAVGYAVGDAQSIIAFMVGRTLAACAAASVGAALLIQTLRHARAFAGGVARESIWTHSANPAATVGTAFLADTLRKTVTEAESVAGEPWRAGAAGAAALVRTTLFPGTVGSAVETGVVHIRALAAAVDSLYRAVIGRFRAAHFQQALPDADVLFLGFGTGVGPTAVVADVVVFRAVPQTFEKLTTIPRLYAQAVEACLLGAAQPALAVASVGAALLALAIGIAEFLAKRFGRAVEAHRAATTGATTAVGAALLVQAFGHTDEGALPIDANKLVGAVTARAAAPVIATLNVAAVGLALAAAAVVTLLYTQVIPGVLATEWVHAADALFARTAVAAGPRCGYTAGSTTTTIDGAGFAILTFPHITNIVATNGTHRCTNAALANLTRKAEAALTTAVVRTTLLTDAVGNANRLALVVDALLHGRAGSARTAAAVAAALERYSAFLAGRIANDLALVIVTKVAILAHAARTAAAVGTAILVGAVRRTLGAVVVLRLTAASAGNNIEPAVGVKIKPARHGAAHKQCGKLRFGFRGPLVETVVKASHSLSHEAIDAALEQLVAGKPHEAGVVEAGRTTRACTAQASTVVGATLFPIAVGHADGNALVVFTLVIGRARTAGTTAAVRATLLARAVGRTATAAIELTLLHTQAVPGEFAAERVDGADTRFTRTTATAGPFGFSTTI